MVVPALAVVASGIAIFVAPGALLLRAAGLRFARGEEFAYAFAGSLALLTAAFAILLALSAPVGAAPAALAGVTLLASGIARSLGASPASAEPEEALPGVRSRLLLLAFTLAAVAAAVAFAPIGSVDRWWYLAYVRSFAEAPGLSLAEPFLGTGQPFARFGVHPWLFGLASWAQLTGVDPVVLYERAAPVIVVFASLTAAVATARALFAKAVPQRLAILAAMLLWSGGLVPLLARAGEDKILAAAALVPLCFTALLRLLRRGGRPRDAFLLAVVASATAAMHSLDYAFVLVAALPVALLALRRVPQRRAAAVAIAVLLAVAAVPAASGLVVRSRLADIGAELSAADHPVVRVHEGRDRLLPLPVAGFVVSPRLLLHPLLLLALLALPALRARRGDDDAAFCDESARDFLLVATLLPPLTAFVPPLPLLAGTVIPPWMVYRVLWLLPAAPLAAMGAASLARRFGAGEKSAAALLLLLAAPVLADSVHDRLAEVRGRLAMPRSGGFHAAMEAVHTLPADAVVVAAPELAERLPALTGRRVAAALDRSTIVFSGSRAGGEARLRARAAALAGDADAAALAGAAGVKPTHALFDPRSVAKPRCGAMLGSWEGYALCELVAEASPPTAPALPVVFEAPSVVLAQGTCGEAAPSSGRDPWSATAPVVDCRVALPESARGRDDLLLRVEASTGRAADELRLTVNGRAAAVRVSGDSTTVLSLPRTDAAVLEVRVASGFLPFVKVKRVAIVAR